MDRLKHRLTRFGLLAVVSLLVGLLPVGPGDLASVYAQTSAEVQAWGRNSQGQLGNGTTTDSSTPVEVADLAGVAMIEGGGEHSLAALSDGTAWAWGQNANGQLGDGTLDGRTTPVQVSGLSGITHVDGGLAHSLALRDDGTVWAWGLNQNGQLGDGTTTQRTTPVQVAGLTGAVAIAAGGDHSLALKSDGTVWSWGKNSDGQLGDGSKKKSSVPVQVTDLADVVAIAGGDAHSLAVKSDGSVWAWGDNFYGQLGDGTTRDRNTPVQVSGLTGATTVAGGSFHSLAVESDGTVWAWGRNVFGQLGDGTTTNRTTPVQTSSLSDAMEVSAGAHHSLATLLDGTSWAWGLNLYGQLGDGTTTNGSTPTQVSTATPIDAVAAGAFHSLGHSVATDTTPPTITLDDPTEGDIVFHIETITATASDDTGVDRVEFSVDGTLIGVATTIPYQTDWDTTGVGDGDYTVSARAFDAVGNSAEASATVTVGNGLRADQRLEADHNAGRLTVDEFALYGVYALAVPPQLPERYRSETLPVEGTIRAYDFLLTWDSLAEETKDEIGSVLGQQWRGGLYVPELNGEGTAGTQSLSIASIEETWTGCVEYADWFLTRCVIESEHFKIHFGLASNNPWDGVPDDPAVDDQLLADLSAGSNNIPDYVDRIAFSLEEAWSVYFGTGPDQLGYRAPNGKIDVSIWGLAPGAGQVLPLPLSKAIELSNQGVTFYLPRHELFHIVEYQYLSFHDFLLMLPNNWGSTWWWMEATAEWGAHQASVASSRPEQRLNYADRLTAFLGRPHLKLTTLESPPPRDPWRGRAYGSFILAEYLEERYGTRTVIRETWEQYDAVIPPSGGDDAIRRTVEARNDNFGEMLTDFAQAAYLLDFSDSDQPEWGTKLEVNSSPHAGEETVGDDLGSARPARLRHTMALNSNDAATTLLEYGGSVYVDIAPAAGSVGILGVDIIDKANAGTMHVQLLAFSQYPTLCTDPIEVPFDSASSSWITPDLLLGEGCTYATLVITNTGNQTAEPDWIIDFSACTEPHVSGTDVFDTGFETLLQQTGGGPAGDEVPRRVPEGGTIGTVFYWSSTGSIQEDGDWGDMAPLNPQPPPGSLAPYNYIWQFSGQAEVGTELEESTVTVSTANPSAGEYHLRVTMPADPDPPFVISTLPTTYAASMTRCADGTTESSQHRLPIWRVDPGETVTVSFEAMTSTLVGQSANGGPWARPAIQIYDENLNALATFLPPIIGDETYKIGTSYQLYEAQLAAPAGAKYALTQVTFWRSATGSIPETFMDLDNFKVEVGSP